LFFAGALDDDGPAVQLHEALHDGQSQTEPPVLAGRRRVPLPEALEQVRDELRPDADAGVRDADLDVGTHPLEPDSNLALPWRELDRIGDEIPDDLLQPARITGDRPGSRIEHPLERDSPWRQRPALPFPPPMTSPERDRTGAAR
jgi:hypothetical protein